MIPKKDDRIVKALKFAIDCVRDEAGPPGTRLSGEHKMTVQMLRQLVKKLGGKK